MLEFCDIMQFFWPTEPLSAAEETFLTIIQLKIIDLCIKTVGQVRKKRVGSRLEVTRENA
jgi:hypothetical protein